MGVSLRTVALLLFGSGLSSLVYQTAWQRTLRLTFGASTGASAAVLAMFLGGLGLGGLILGRRLEKVERPLLAYGNLELGIALLAAASPFVADGVHAVYLWLGGTQTLGVVGATCVRLLGALVVVGPAAFLMGGTLPAAARAVVAEEDIQRRNLALLYALNTSGAVVGALVGPLLLFGLFGNRLTLWAAVCLNLLVAVVARAGGRRVPALSVDTEATVHDGASATGNIERGRARIVFAVATSVGFVFLALELVWYRMLAPLLGGSSVTFGLILATALAGIGTGGFLYSKRPLDRPIGLALLGTTLALEGLFTMLPFVWGDDFALVVAHMRTMVNLGFGHLVGVWLWVAVVVVFPASVVSGYQFPLIFSLLGRGRAGVARQVGVAYGFNTVGTISGSLLAGFVLIPALGAVHSWRWLALSLIGLAVVVGWAAWRETRRLEGLALPAILGACTSLLALAPGPGAVWRHTPIGAGRVDVSSFSENQMTEWQRAQRASVVWESEGLESSVAMTATQGLSFIVNGKADGSVMADRGTQAFLGLLPAALHGAPKSAFVVGLGTGMTAGLLARVQGVEHVMVAELEPSIVEVARQARLVNGDALGNPRVSIEFGDGRELLLTGRAQYDLIISEPSNPYRIGIAALFTNEFYRAAASRLAPGGLFAQWIQGYEIDGQALAVAITTMQSVFPHVSLWGPEGSDLILIGSHRPQVVDVAALRQRLDQPVYRTWMPRAWGSEGAEGLLAHHLAPHQLVVQLANAFPRVVNVDDLNVLEFAFARHVGEDGYNAVAEIIDLTKASEHRPAVRGSVDWARVDDLRYRVGWPGYQGAPPSKRARAVLAGCGGKTAEALSLWPEDETPSDAVETWVLATALAAAGKGDQAVPLIDTLRRRGFEMEALASEARLLEFAGNDEGATEVVVRAFDEFRKTALPLCDSGGRLLRQARRITDRAPQHAGALLRAVARGPFAVYEEETQRLLVRAALGARTGVPALCVLGLGNEPGPWTLQALALRAACFRDAADARAPAAMAGLSQFLALETASFANPAQALLVGRAWAGTAKADSISPP